MSSRPAHVAESPASPSFELDRPHPASAVGHTESRFATPSFFSQDGYIHERHLNEASRGTQKAKAKSNTSKQNQMHAQLHVEGPPPHSRLVSLAKAGCQAD